MGTWGRGEMGKQEGFMSSDNSSETQMNSQRGVTSNAGRKDAAGLRLKLSRPWEEAMRVLLLTKPNEVGNPRSSESMNGESEKTESSETL
jgi:hypothetical protein